MRGLRRVAAAAGLLALPFVLEAAWFARVLATPAPPPRADLLAVYGGDYQRYASGWTLERAGTFRYLVFSDASPGFVAEMERHFGRPRRATLLLEPNARNTSQNARYVARLAEAHGCRSLMVLTSWWHLPRALFLTRLALLGRGIRVLGWPLASASAPDDRPASVLGDPRVWEEGLRLWGSLATFWSDTRRTDPGLGLLPY